MKIPTFLHISKKMVLVQVQLLDRYKHVEGLGLLNGSAAQENLPDISSITWSDVSNSPYFNHILTVACILTAAVAIVLPLTLARRL